MVKKPTCPTLIVMGPPPPCDPNYVNRRTVKLTPLLPTEINPEILKALKEEGLLPYKLESGEAYMAETDGTIWGTKSHTQAIGIADYYYTKDPDVLKDNQR